MSVLKTEFRGEGGALFFLTLKVGFLTLITLGLYWFWAKAKLRRWYWSAIRPGGAPLEYAGTGMEKFAGFLFAVSVLSLLSVAGFFGVVALIARFGEDYPVTAVILPLAYMLSFSFLFFFARYRAKRYLLGRTSWRGIRMGMSRGAFGYAWRGTLYAILSMVSLGLLLPLATFRLEKFCTDRTWFGNARFTQHGNALRLFGPVFPFLVTFWGGFGLLAYFLYVNGWTPGPSAREVWAAIAANVMIWVSIIFALYYRVASVRVMTALKTLGDGIEFDLWPRTRRIVIVYILGSIKAGLAAAFATAAIAAMLFGMLSVAGLLGGSSGISFGSPSPILMALILLVGLIYGMLILVFTQVFIIYPIVRHIAETLEIHQPELLGGIRQRDDDNIFDADGFAEALDVGAAI